MPTPRELGRQAQLDALQAVRRLEVKAITGKPRSNGSFTLRGDATNGDGPLPANKVYVRLDNNEQEVLDVYAASGIGWRVNTPVLVKRDDRGEWRIVSLDDKAATELYGKNAPMMSQAPVDTDVAPILVAGKHYKPGSLFNSTASTLQVRVRPFYYRYFDSVKYHTGAESLDLTSALPSTSNYWAWVWVGVNPITEALEAKTGTEHALQTALTIADLVSIDMTGLIPSDAIQLQEGITAINGLSHKIGFGREMLAYTTTVPSTVGTARVGSGNTYQFYNSVTFSGAFTVDGEIRIAA